VKTYTLYVHDGRYAVPTLLTVEMRDDERVREYAAQRLAESVHYKAVEIWEDDRAVAHVTADGSAG
jgi:hypothetical protein